MGNLLYAAILIMLLIQTIQSRAIDDMDNSISDGKSFPENKEWVHISEVPPLKVIQPIGSTVELECEVTGSPTPTVEWIRGKNIEQRINDFTSNLISESSGNSLVRVRSRLLVEIDDAEENVYTCVGQSGQKTAYASSTVYPSGTYINQHNITDILAINRNSDIRKPRVILFYSVIFEEIGANLVLPCKAAGRPHPTIYWLDNNENAISGRDPRIRVLPSGELLISYLRWSDMGMFTCIAQSAIGKDSVSTFVYPVLVS